MAYSNTRTVRIEWGDCDPAGIIFYPCYFEIFDASTSALFERALGMTKLKALKAFNFVGYPLVHTHARFMKPTRFGDDVTIVSEISFGKSSFEVKHVLSLNGEVAVDGEEKRVWVVRDANGALKSQAIPAEVIAKFQI
ncbi:MAG TPA: thioesterase family protein [Pseudolabrys sp.]|jgi:4-hydroxybenzoyl-CoA thioesterase|nr:thioesterase family protein [Pseudolabrys sp.]